MPHNSFACYICNELGTVKDGKSNDFYELASVAYEKRCGSTMFNWLKRPKQTGSRKRCLREPFEYSGRLQYLTWFNMYRIHQRRLPLPS